MGIVSHQTTTPAAMHSDVHWSTSLYNCFSVNTINTQLIRFNAHWFGQCEEEGPSQLLLFWVSTLHIQLLAYVSCAGIHTNTSGYVWRFYGTLHTYMLTWAAMCSGVLSHLSLAFKSKLRPLWRHFVKRVWRDCLGLYTYQWRAVPMLSSSRPLGSILSFCNISMIFYDGRKERETKRNRGLQIWGILWKYCQCIVKTNLPQNSKFKKESINRKTTAIRS